MTSAELLAVLRVRQAAQSAARVRRGDLSSTNDVLSAHGSTSCPGDKCPSCQCH